MKTCLKIEKIINNEYWLFCVIWTSNTLIDVIAETNLNVADDFEICAK